MTIKSIFCFPFIFIAISASAQNSYRYSTDLNIVTNDMLDIKLQTPKVKSNTITFHFPRIVPGTYMNSNYGKYVHDLVANDAAGRKLPVKRNGDNSWVISNALKLATITYKVEDTWDSKIDNKVYTMCGTNFEEGKNFVLNTPGIFGYFEGMKDIPFDIEFKKPLNFYAATGLKPVRTTSTTDKFICRNLDELYDSPIMFSLPDTTTIKVGNAEVLVAIYSPKKLATSKFIATHMNKLLAGTKDYLGGKLPVDKYAFIFYFNEENPPLNNSGAWEHSYSSFYSLEGEPQEQGIAGWVDIAAHEFFHIVTPLTISSRQVKKFNFQETDLSQHVWLYEGSTEYSSVHMQVQAGITTPEQFLDALSGKIRYSRQYMNDTLSFTELGKESAGKWKDQYGNVYMKGALISACLDLYLLHLSGGKYSMQDLKHDLGVKYGKDRFFEDSTLFREIGALTYPEIEQFLIKYVGGATPIPYQQFFNYAGVQYLPVDTVEIFTFGGLDIRPENGAQVLYTQDMNDFGKAMGYKSGDQLISFNGISFKDLRPGKVIDSGFLNRNVNDPVTVVVNRKNELGKYEHVSLQGRATKVKRPVTHVLKLDPVANQNKLKIRAAWLGVPPLNVKKVSALASDVTTIDSIMKAMYVVLSGPAGKRDWDRFRSLFHAEGYMGALTPKKTLVKFSPERYISNNAPFMEKYSFYETELGRIVNQFGDVAQVFSTYEYVAGMTPPEKKRGVNNIQLVREGGRWFIMSIIWDEERADQPIPAQYLKLK